MIEQAGHGTVTIGAVEKYITETAWDRGLGQAGAPATRARAVRRHHRRRAGRPGGGRAAAPQGLPGDVYDRYDRVGGLLVYGIPNFKLEKEVVRTRAG